MDEVLFSEMSFHGRCWNAILQIASCFFCHIVISLCAFILVFILLLIQESKLYQKRKGNVKSFDELDSVLTAKTMCFMGQEVLFV